MEVACCPNFCDEGAAAALVSSWELLRRAYLILDRGSPAAEEQDEVGWHIERAVVLQISCSEGH